MTLFYLEIQKSKRPPSTWSPERESGLESENAQGDWQSQVSPDEKREGIRVHSEHLLLTQPLVQSEFHSFFPSSLSTLSPSPSLKCLPSSIPSRKVSVTWVSVPELEALFLCYKHHAGLSSMWFLICLLGTPWDKKLRVSVFCMCPALIPVPGT